jgi:multiple sugar transport system substrate-binding protein
MLIKRRTLLTLAAASPALLDWAHAWAADQPFMPEKGATLRLLRGATFLPAEGETTAANAAAFTAATGVPVTIDNVNQDDLVSKTALASQISSGPDIIWTQNTAAHLFPGKLVDVTDVADYLGKKYGGWYPVCIDYGTEKGRWICIPVFLVGSLLNYRISWMHEAGFEKMPTDTAGFLKLCQALKAKGHPPGFALGNAVGDANTWCHWLVWAFGGKMVDEKDRVVINSPETIAALEYAKQLYATFIPGTLSWLDPSNNKAFLDGQLSVTNNGISIYYAAKTSSDPAIKALANDIGHASLPVGPAGKPTELHLSVPAMVFKYTKYKNAAKDYIRFMMEKEQYEPWQTASIGYWSQPLKEYEKLPIWTSDPKHTPYRDVMSRMLWPSYAGSLGYASASVLADYVLVNRVAQAASGAKTPKEAVEEAHKRAERYYKL